MTEHKVHETDANDVIRKAQDFWQKFQKPISIAIAALVVIIGGWYGYKAFIVDPNETKAEETIFLAQQYFAADSFKIALSGDANGKGFLYIINNYGGTKEGNLAKFYAGICYLKTGDFNKAIKYLSDFSTNAKQIQMVAYGALGDAYSELGKNDDAVNYYKKASSTFEKDEATSSEYLFRAALKLETLGKNSEALELYKELKDKFPTTDRGTKADKYIYRLSIIPNDFSTK